MLSNLAQINSKLRAYLASSFRPAHHLKENLLVGNVMLNELLLSVTYMEPIDTSRKGGALKAIDVDMKIWK